MKNHMMIALCIATLSGCAGMQYAVDNYGKTKHVVWKDAASGTTFWVFDKPSESRMMVTLSAGGAAAQGIGDGLTLNAGVVKTPEIIYQNAGIAFLKSTGRSCRATQTSLIVEPQYEVRYSCD